MLIGGGNHRAAGNGYTGSDPHDLADPQFRAACERERKLAQGNERVRGTSARGYAEYQPTTSKITWVEPALLYTDTVPSAPTLARRLASSIAFSGTM